ncbi:Holliday junction DNA helicase, RuvA subunit [Halobacteroides halobius DSM 5150]|uniref:Holliday junction branch migration complex subunit RuvA n=1 Tax=Halobacteroides halobius (strain ATCC 35273 / DSM 5150 / MD-1) TaxID=748449 RepID=L0KCH7_HALHC|nr:Holliday junction branch migration protein RuvA [Halobacteroides halobius]AGB41773.1 Holliday junction DNA helicase, RuvA subunit [Halobacteroides halobius DSM 5150]
MIAYLCGDLLRQGIEYVVVKVDGVGYKVYLPASLQDGLTIGSEVELHIYTYVREDAIKLYGFSTLEELELFERLLSVSKIGPKASLSILGTMTVREFKLAVINGEVKTLKQAKGIGNKTAKRLILELQEKVEINDITNSREQLVNQGQINDAVNGLVNLGYNKRSAREAVTKIAKEKQDLEVEEIIKEGLQYLSQ